MNRLGRPMSNTCLAVLRDTSGKLWFAGDRRVSWGMHRAQRMVKPKIAKRDGILLAGTGVGSLCDEIVQLLQIPEQGKHGDPFLYIHEVFMPSLFEHLRHKGYLHKEERRLGHNGEGMEDHWFGAAILIGLKGQLFELDVDNEHIGVDLIDAPHAHGCGGDLALGSLLTTEGTKLHPKTRLEKALRVAAQVSPGCDDNIDVLHE